MGYHLPSDLKCIIQHIPYYCFVQVFLEFSCIVIVFLSIYSVCTRTKIYILQFCNFSPFCFCHPNTGPFYPVFNHRIKVRIILSSSYAFSNLRDHIVYVLSLTLTTYDLKFISPGFIHKAGSNHAECPYFFILISVI